MNINYLVFLGYLRGQRELLEKLIKVHQISTEDFDREIELLEKREALFQIALHEEKTGELSPEEGLAF